MYFVGRIRIFRAKVHHYSAPICTTDSGWILRFEWCQPFRSDDASYFGSNDAILG